MVEQNDFCAMLKLFDPFCATSIGNDQLTFSQIDAVSQLFA